MFLWLSMVAGFRRGEMVALRWTHVDFDRGTLTVQRSLAQTRGGLLEKDTKSNQGRGVSLDDQTVETWLAEMLDARGYHPTRHGGFSRSFSRP